MPCFSVSRPQQFVSVRSSVQTDHTSYRNHKGKLLFVVILWGFPAKFKETPWNRLWLQIFQRCFNFFYQPNKKKFTNYSKFKVCHVAVWDQMSFGITLICIFAFSLFSTFLLPDSSSLPLPLLQSLLVPHCLFLSIVRDSKSPFKISKS